MDLTGSEKNISEKKYPEVGAFGEEIEGAPQETNNVTDYGEFRTALPQVLAVSTINLILLDLGMVLAFPTVVIPDLLKSTGNMTFTEEQASWFGSIAFICQPLGSFFSGLLFEPIGRKKTMLYVNIPLLVGWLLIYFSTTIDFLYVGGLILGVGIGFMDAPHITYLGEITQPKWRGILTSYAELCVALGFSFVYFLGTAANWRTTSFMCSFVPVISILLLTQIPESPIWLLSKGRREEAEKSLRWLRGWVKSEAVREEFQRIVQHNKSTLSKTGSVTPNNCDETDFMDRIENQNTGLGKKILAFTGIRDILRRSVLQPFFLVVTYFGFSHVAGVTSTRPFMVDILKEFGTPLDPNWVTAISSVIGIFGYITGMILLRKNGKRLLSLLSMWGCAITNILIFLYGFFFSHLNVPLILVILFVLLNFIWSFGIGQIPWMLISEVFPFKGKGIASGVTAALSYVLAFIFTKTYYATRNFLTLPGVFGFYGVCTLIGGCFLYSFLPETEGKTLEQIEKIIENHFNKFRRKSEKLNKSNETTYQSTF